MERPVAWPTCGVGVAFAPLAYVLHNASSNLND